MGKRHARNPTPVQDRLRPHEKKIIRLYVRRRLPLKEVAREFQCSPDAIACFLKSSGVQLRRGGGQPRLRPEDRQTIFAQWRAAKTCLELAARYAVCPQVVVNLLKDGGIYKMRGCAPRTWPDTLPYKQRIRVALLVSTEGSIRRPNGKKCGVGIYVYNTDRELLMPLVDVAGQLREVRSQKGLWMWCLLRSADVYWCLRDIVDELVGERRQTALYVIDYLEEKYGFGGK